MAFPDDIKLALRDCALKLLWPRNDIITFLESDW